MASVLGFPPWREMVVFLDITIHEASPKITSSKYNSQDAQST
jgi:hypothetical protein